MTQKYNTRKSISKQFPNIRSEDQLNLRTVLKALGEEGLHVRLAGSALKRTDYNDIDLGAWDKDREQYKKRPVESLLEKLGVTEYERMSIAATWVHGWARFEYQGTRFDLVCTNHEARLGYLEK